MDLPRIFWLAFALFFVTKIAFKIARRQPTGPTTKQPPPPVARGIPFLGVVPTLLAKGPLELIRDKYTRLGSVFTMRLFHLNVTFLVGPEVSNHFYQGLDSEISQDEVSQFTIPTFGPGVAFDVDYATRREQFRFFGDAMKPVKLRTYVGHMVSEVEVSNNDQTVSPGTCMVPLFLEGFSPVPNGFSFPKHASHVDVLLCAESFFEMGTVRDG